MHFNDACHGLVRRANLEGFHFMQYNILVRHGTGRPPGQVHCRGARPVPLTILSPRKCARAGPPPAQLARSAVPCSQATFFYIFLRDQYTFRIHEMNKEFTEDYPGRPTHAQIQAMLTPESTYPVVRVTTHWDYAPDVSRPSYCKTLQRGYCLSAGAQQSTPGAAPPDARCAEFSDLAAVQVSLFLFEKYFDWLWDPRCAESQRAHYARVAAEPEPHRWDAAQLEELWECSAPFTKGTVLLRGSNA